MLELNAVIFDMDGLMFATEQVNCRAFMEVVKEEGYHPTFEPVSYTHLTLPTNSLV